MLFPGDKIPAEYQLMKQYNVSRITVSKALNELKSEGIVERFPNKGTFVAKTSNIQPFLSQVSITEVAPSSANTIPEVACIIPSIPDKFSLSM